ncbi:MAG TPA: hypothetical protein EYN79_01925 [Planctomycetes bacterium]|nr:hypothetical protein [Planctomycetota bacterium]HIN81280.1 hypothetical protein [Planctomycetota bacterium]
MQDRATFRLNRFPVAALLLLFCVLPWLGAEVVDENTPVPPVGALGGPERELTPAELEKWKNGRLLFDRDWTLSEGMGTPELNADSCRGCHSDPVIGGSGGLDLNVFRYGRDEGGAGPFTNLPGGQVASKIRRPDFPLRDEVHPDADVFEQRQTPIVFGLGMIDLIPESEILANEDPFDSNNDGIRGRAHMIDIASGGQEVGRFGWKNVLPQIGDFIHDALGGETGLTAPDNGRGFVLLTDDDGVADPEITAAQFDDMLFYCSHLCPPPRVGNTDPAVAVGEALFTSIGCAACHIPSLEGADGPLFLYSDLLLHDIHPAGFRGMVQGDAGVGEYRTGQLWGLRLSAPYLHDGSATTIEDAILRHDDEALSARQGYENLSASDVEALLLFLSDL